MATTDTVAEDSARLDRFGRGVVETFAVALTLGAVAWAADLYRAIGLVLFTEQFLAAMLGLALPIVFVNVPATRGGTGRLPWYDTIAAVAAFVACWYVAWTYPRLSNELVYHPPDALVVSAVLLVLIVEGLRRAVGKVLVILLLAFLAYAMWGHHIPGKLTGREVDTATIVIGLALDPQALLGVPMQIATTIVIAFVLLGHVLFESGGSSFFTGISMATMGRYRGGSAKIAVTASALFGSISGSAVSNVVSTGVITIPLMREAGYSSEAAGGIEAVASTGGQLMPPIMGASAFVMAEFLQISYAEVVIAALVPAVLYYAALFIVSDLEAGRTRIARVEEHALPQARAILKAGWFFPLPFGVLVYALFGLHQRPEAAALYATLSLLACTATLGYQGRRTGLGTLMKAVRQTGHACIDIILIVAAAGLVIGVLNISGLSFGLTLTLVQIGQGNLIVLLLMAAGICILLGMGMPTLGVYVLLASLVAPALVEVGVDQMAAHLFVLYYGMMSMITPPIAIAAFAAASLTRADPMRTALAACRFGWLAYVIPFLIVASPTLIMRGAPTEIAVDVVTAFAGVWLVSVALMGFFVRALGAGARLLFAVAGFAAFIPVAAFAGAAIVTSAGVALGVALFAWELIVRRRAVTRA